MKSHNFWLSQIRAMTLMETLGAVSMGVLQKMWGILMDETLKTSVGPRCV